jgi:demethylmenaquinone methyltransferase/2-methoxy-6-polyprenyl-1,4-benzoquinol methylase
MTASAWTREELADPKANPHADTHKAGKVRGMFGAIAPSYDLNNRVHSLWQDVRWRNFAVKLAGVKEGEKVLDLACGTGDLTQAFARTPADSVLGVDFTPAMLARAGVKRSSLPQDIARKITYQEGDATGLDLPDESFDVVSMAWGLRNVTIPGRAIRECARVLKPAGRLVILEFGKPKLAPVRWFNDFYCGWIMPRTATMIARDKSGAYHYLPKSVSTFMTPEQVEGLCVEAGLGATEHHALSFGLCYCYRASKSCAS